MNRRTWLAVMAVAGIGIFALGFVDGWIVHDRELRGEGYRLVEVVLGAWEERGFPILAAGTIVALVVGIGAALAWAGRAFVPGWLLVIGAFLALGVLASGAFPVSQDSLASSVDLSLGWPVAVAVVLGILLAGAGVMAFGPRPAIVAAGTIVAVVAFAAGSGGRWYGLQVAEGDGRHWSDGSYTRAAVGEQPTETLTFDGDRITIGDRWSGSLDWNGWVVNIEDDPACPDSRGTYHAHGEGEEDLSFVKIIDTCHDGERAADLETGIWERVP
ncbi:MAG TPA: hypothetical protein VJ975_05200 [Candidatus Limnocylindria bacterium]|nr:hypothetical protein [Candidatus Limnocylindria bacterium]